VAEESGLIVSLGQWVLRAACRALRGWQTRGLLSIPVAINISALQFARPDFASAVAAALAESEVEPRWLELELTESILMAEASQVLDTLHALKRLGVRLTMDDFGTGYSSLSYLHRFALDKLKIDRAFVRELKREGNGDATAIVQAIIALATGHHRLGQGAAADDSRRGGGNRRAARDPSRLRLRRYSGRLDQPALD